MYIMECASVLCIYRPPTKLREGNVFTGVCRLCTGGDRAVPFLDTVFPPRHHIRPWDTVPSPPGHQVVRIYWNAFLFLLVT